jgi:hypothetical protein
MSTLCMKIDPGMHIGMHLVFFGKTGVIGVEKTSRLRSRDPVASGVKCGPHGGMNSKMKSWTVSW